MPNCICRRRVDWNCHWLLGKQSERRAADAAVVELENPKHDLRNIDREEALRILRDSDVNLSSAITSTIRLNERLRGPVKCSVATDELPHGVASWIIEWVAG